MKLLKKPIILPMDFPEEYGQIRELKSLKSHSKFVLESCGQIPLINLIPPHLSEVIKKAGWEERAEYMDYTLMWS